MPPMHPEVRAYLEATRASGAPPLHTVSIEEARSRAKGLRVTPDADDLPCTISDHAIATSDGQSEISVRRYQAVGASAVGAITWFHGGGWTLLDIDDDDLICQRLAHAAQCEVVSVGYRRAPEHPFPAPLDDAFTALTWVEREICSTRLPLVAAGDSAGGNLVAACALRAREDCKLDIALQVLIYPVLDSDLTRPSFSERIEGLFISRDTMEWFWNNYVPRREDRMSSWVAPLRAESLASLPPTIMIVAQYDPLRDEQFAYWHRLRDEGNRVTFVRYTDMHHGFFRMPATFSRAGEAVEALGRDIKSRFENGAPDLQLYP